MLVVLLSTRTGEDAGEGIVAFVTGKFIDLVIGLSQFFQQPMHDAAAIVGWYRK